jgi:hypothetical protein
MTHWLEQHTSTVFLAIEVCGFIFAVLCLSVSVYGPVTRTRQDRLNSTDCYHFQRGTGPYTIGPETCLRRSRALLLHRPFKKLPAGYFFARRPSRWALWNSTQLRSSSGPVTVHTLTAGALVGIDRRRMAYRHWDGALALLDGHLAPMTVQEFPTITAWRDSLKTADPAAGGD